jgi:hypothetical protein
MKPNYGHDPSQQVIYKHNKLLSSIFAFIFIYTNVNFMYVCANISIFNTIFVPIMKCYQKVPGLGQKRNAGLTLLNFG